MTESKDWRVLKRIAAEVAGPLNEALDVMMFAKAGAKKPVEEILWDNKIGILRVLQAVALTHPEAQGNKDLGEPGLRSLKCKNCAGTGEIVFTRERGGPRCPECGGFGHLTRAIFVRVVASILDHPSVYMGGPSRGNTRRAESIADSLGTFGLFTLEKALKTPQNVPITGPVDTKADSASR